MGTIKGFFKRETQLNCAKCCRSWAVPKELGKTPDIFIAQRIPALPGGQCPNCGKLYCQGCARARFMKSRKPVFTLKILKKEERDSGAV